MSDREQRFDDETYTDPEGCPECGSHRLCLDYRCGKCGWDCQKHDEG